MKMQRGRRRVRTVCVNHFGPKGFEEVGVIMDETQLVPKVENENGIGQSLVTRNNGGGVCPFAVSSAFDFILVVSSYSIVKAELIFCL